MALETLQKISREEKQEKRLTRFEKLCEIFTKYSSRSIVVQNAFHEDVEAESFVEIVRLVRKNKKLWHSFSEYLVHTFHPQFIERLSKEVPEFYSKALFPRFDLSGFSYKDWDNYMWLHDLLRDADVNDQNYFFLLQEEIAKIESSYPRFPQLRLHINNLSIQNVQEGYSGSEIDKVTQELLDKALREPYINSKEAILLATLGPKVLSLKTTTHQALQIFYERYAGVLTLSSGDHQKNHQDFFGKLMFTPRPFSLKASLTRMENLPKTSVRSCIAQFLPHVQYEIDEGREQIITFHFDDIAELSPLQIKNAFEILQAVGIQLIHKICRSL